MTTTTPRKLTCSHDGVHGSDDEPGAVQRCHEETILLRVEQAIGSRLYEMLTKFADEELPALMNRTIRETWIHAQKEGSYEGEVLLEMPDWQTESTWLSDGSRRPLKEQGTASARRA